MDHSSGSKGHGPKRQELTGILERFTPKGAIISDRLFIWSRWMKGERPDESHLGCELRVLAEPVEGGADRFYVRQVLSIGDRKVSVTSPSGSGGPSGARPTGGGAFRRFSPEELALKKDEGVRIARSVAIDRAIDLARHGIPIEKVGVTATEIEKYLLTGKLPGMDPQGGTAAEGDASEEVSAESPSSGKKSSTGDGKGGAKSRTSRVESRRINELFNLARKAKVVVAFPEFEILCRKVLGPECTSAYFLTSVQFDLVEKHVRGSLPGNVAGGQRVAS